ncbi:MAG: nicotinamide riboside transporter PnuC [Oleiphilaceae bacterium]|jgi:nicotinamide riboside transporter PnuC
MNTPPTDLPDEIHPRIRWGWLVYVILCNGILLLTFALPLTKSFLGWFELLFLITISVGGILYALNRTFLQKWFWNIVFWLIVLHFLLLNYLYWGSILNTSLLDVLFVGVLFIPNAYLTFKYAHRDKIKSENVPPDKQTPQNRWVRIIFLVITLIVIMLSFLSVLKFFDSQDTLPLEEQYEKIQTKLYERGLMYQRGKGVPKDDKQAAML